jgi:hypothetical protein
MSGPTRSGTVSVWHVAWLLVFVVDASLQGHGRSHQLGAVALGTLFATLVVGELRANRRQRYDDGRGR